MDLFEIGEIVQQHRKARRWTQQQLADAAGLSRVRINRLESGTVFEMNFGSIMNVLNALDLDLKIGDYNVGRPTLDDLQHAEFELEDFPEP